MKPVTYAFRGGVLCADRGGDAAGQRLAGSGMLPFMTPIFLQVGMGSTPFHAGLMMIPMVLGNRGMKRIVVQIVNRFGYRKVLIALPALVFRHVPADVSKNAMLSRRPGRH